MTSATVRESPAGIAGPRRRRLRCASRQCPRYFSSSRLVARPGCLAEIRTGLSARGIKTGSRAYAAALLAWVAAGCSVVPNPPKVLPFPVHTEHASAHTQPQVCREIRAFVYEHADPRALVVLVHGVGTNARIWDLPNQGGLAPDLQREGFLVVSVDHAHSSCADDSSQIPSPCDLGHLSQALAELLQGLRRDYPSLPILGVGHDLGGTALYMVAAEGPHSLDGVVGLSAPLSFGAATVAVQSLLERTSRAAVPIDWLQLRDELPSGFSAALSYERALLSTGMPSKQREAFFTAAVSPLRPSLLRSLAKPDPSPSPGVADLIAELSARPQLAVLAVVALADGLAPPWQTDPEALGLRRDNVQRLYLTRGNGHAREYNHQDMLVHPDAEDDVFAPINRWLKQISDIASKSREPLG